MKKLRLAWLLRRLSRGSLRDHLFALVLVSVLPILIFAALVLNLFARQEKASLATGLRETARALTSAMDREFEATRTALEAVATMEVLDSGDLAQFYRVLRRVLQSRSNWKTIILQDPAGNQILNLLNPFGEPLPEIAAEEESFRALIQTKRPTPINFHQGGPATGPTVGFRVPVLRSGELKYVLSVEMDPAVFRALLARQKLPLQGIATIADARNIIVATTGSQELIGQNAGSLIGPASPAQLDGWIEGGPNHEGIRYYAAYSRSPNSGWFVALTAPAVLFEGPLKRSLWALGGAGVIFLVAGIIGAVIVESRISESLHELTRKAEALGRGQPVAGDAASPIAEVEKLNQDIQRAALLLVERERERDRAEGALRDSNDRLELRIQERTVQLEGANKELRKEINDRHAAEDALRSEHVYLNLLRSTELVIHEATGIEAVFGAALEEICRHLKWRLGHCLLESEPADQDRRVSLWYLDSEWDRAGLDRLRVALESASYNGSPAAQALATRELEQCSDLSIQPQSWAGAAISAGLVAACAFPVIAGGKPVGALAFFSDRVISLDSRLTSILDQLALQLGRVVERQQAVEALRLSEERFRSAFDDGPIGIAMVDLKLRYLRVNEALCQMLGCQSGELLGQNLFENIHPLDRAQSQLRTERLLMEKDHGYSAETRMITRAGEILWCCLTATLIAARDGRPNYALFLIENISQRKRMEEKLRESERLAAVGATSAMLAHEVGNPLNGISTTVQMIERDLSQRRDGVQSVVFSALADIRNEINRLGALLHEFRFLARPQRLELEPVRLEAMVRDVLAVEAYAARDIDVEIDIPGDLPLLYVDQEKLTQVIANLVDNSADAMPQGGKLTVSAYLSGEEILLEVRDTGIGIPPGVNVFEFFTTTKPNGTGLGLAVVRQIVSAHGGRVEYHSQVGKGTVFTVALPVDNGSRL